MVDGKLNFLESAKNKKPPVVHILTENAIDQPLEAYFFGRGIAVETQRIRSKLLCDYSGRC